MTELYDRLISKCTRLSFSKDHSPLNASALKDHSRLQSLADQINGFDHQAIEMTFVLIRIHSLRSGNSKGFFQLPYEGKSEAPTGDTSIVNVIFNLDNFPDDLLCLLDQFARTVEGSRGEATKLKPIRSPRSPRQSPKQTSNSFMKANRQKPIPEIVLQEIDCASLDKTYSMDEILKYGEKSFFTELSNDLSTSTDDIGLTEDTRHHHRLIIERNDSFLRDPLELSVSDEFDNRISVYNTDTTPCCFYCTLSIPEEWNPVPAYDGIFCSFHCARSYSIEYRKPYSVLINLFRKLKRKEAPIITRSPDRLLLHKFGGSLSEEEYRRMFNSQYPVQTISQSMADPICTSGDDGNDGYSTYNRSSSGSYAIQYKAAATCSMNEPEKCIRIYKAN
jgi:hypothetical protein